MTNLPFISHHLFVAAVASEVRGGDGSSPHYDYKFRTTGDEPSPPRRPNPAGHARAIPLEVMEHARGMASAARPLRAVQAASRP